MKLAISLVVPTAEIVERIIRRGIEMKLEEVLGINKFECSRGKGLEMQLRF
jgi:hypothetical protein